MGNHINTIYVTPAGYICTCGRSENAITGAESLKKARSHDNRYHYDAAGVVDYRLVKAPSFP